MPFYSRLNLLSLNFQTVLDFAICSIQDLGILGQNLNILDLSDVFQTYLIHLLMSVLLHFDLLIPNITVFDLVGTPDFSMPQVLHNY